MNGYSWNRLVESIDNDTRRKPDRMADLRDLGSWMKKNGYVPADAERIKSSWDETETQEIVDSINAAIEGDWTALDRTEFRFV